MKTFVIFLFISVFSFSYSQEWNLAIEKNGITVYARKIKGLDISETKTMITLDLPKEKVLQFLWQIDNYPVWQKECFKAEVLSIKNKVNMNVYLGFDAPWPVRNRDVITNMEQKTVEEDIYIYIQSLKEILAHKKGIIRMSSYDGYWKIEELEENKTKLTLQMRADPSGVIPNFLIEFYKTTGPYNYFNSLRKSILS